MIKATTGERSDALELRVYARRMGRGRKPQRAIGAAPSRVPTTAAPTCVAQPNGTRKWYVDGQLHREDGPAVECASGERRWYLNGKRHREDGPAIERPDGTKVWFKNGRLHRENGPAMELADGSWRFFLNGEEHPQPPAPPVGDIGPRSRISALANRAA